MRFTKMQGVGNDFVVLDAAALPSGADLPVLAMTLCDRHVGVGADGLLVVSRNTPGSAFSMRMFNPDGTEDMCGNGLRCVGLWALRAGWVTAAAAFNVATKEGPKAMRLLEVSDDGRSGSLRVGIGIPKFAPKDIPFSGTSRERIVGYPLDVAGETYFITATNTGSTHTVIFGVVPPDEETFQRVSPLIELHPQFPERTSVLWATPQGESTIAVRIWERGVGETLGCGTGACAVGAAARLQGLSEPSVPVSVVSKGGSLTIDWRGEGYPVVLSGPAEIVYDGEIVVSPEALPQDTRKADL